MMTPVRRDSVLFGLLGRRTTTIAMIPVTVKMMPGRKSMPGSIRSPASRYKDESRGRLHATDRRGWATLPRTPARARVGFRALPAAYRAPSPNTGRHGRIRGAVARTLPNGAAITVHVWLTGAANS